MTQNGRVYQLRTYRATRGKLPALEARFRDHTVKLFAKHGMDVIGFWVPADDDGATAETLVYLLGFESREAADAAWASFRKDEDWLRIHAESEQDGPLVESIDAVYLAATDYSPMH